jgi:uncharacterized protein
VESVLHALQSREAYYWATQGGAELDLYLPQLGGGVGIEVKRSDAPRMTPSIRSALADLALERVVVIYPGDRRYRLAANVEVVPMSVLADAGAAIETLTGL